MSALWAHFMSSHALLVAPLEASLTPVAWKNTLAVYMNRLECVVDPTQRRNEHYMLVHQKLAVMHIQNTGSRVATLESTCRKSSHSAQQHQGVEQKHSKNFVMLAKGMR